MLTGSIVILNVQREPPNLVMAEKKFFLSVLCVERRSLLGLPARRKGEV
jgi:hypothetical protein